MQLSLLFAFAVASGAAAQETLKLAKPWYKLPTGKMSVIRWDATELKMVLEDVNVSFCSRDLTQCTPIEMSSPDTASLWKGYVKVLIPVDTAPGPYAIKVGSERHQDSSIEVEVVQGNPDEFITFHVSNQTWEVGTRIEIDWSMAPNPPESDLHRHSFGCILSDPNVESSSKYDCPNSFDSIIVKSEKEGPYQFTVKREWLEGQKAFIRYEESMVGYQRRGYKKKESVRNGTIGPFKVIETSNPDIYKRVLKVTQPDHKLHSGKIAVIFWEADDFDPIETGYRVDLCAPDLTACAPLDLTNSLVPGLTANRTNIFIPESTEPGKYSLKFYDGLFRETSFPVEIEKGDPTVKSVLHVPPGPWKLGTKLRFTWSIEPESSFYGKLCVARGNTENCDNELLRTGGFALFNGSYAISIPSNWTAANDYYVFFTLSFFSKPLLTTKYGPFEAIAEESTNDATSTTSVGGATENSLRAESNEIGSNQSSPGTANGEGAVVQELNALTESNAILMSPLVALLIVLVSNV